MKTHSKRLRGCSDPMQPSTHNYHPDPTFRAAPPFAAEARAGALGQTVARHHQCRAAAGLGCRRTWMCQPISVRAVHATGRSKPPPQAT
eukprot:scaffold75152_cov33-Phaeocystis_antarctica.AAC.2